MSQERLMASFKLASIAAVHWSAYIKYFYQPGISFVEKADRRKKISPGWKRKSGKI